MQCGQRGSPVLYSLAQPGHATIGCALILATVSALRFADTRREILAALQLMRT
jgi:hypothetical protein